MSRLLHSPEIRRRLRPLRPAYDAVFRRTKDLSRSPAPAERIAAMAGRGVFLFAFGRCGTTVFADYLASHPRVTSFGEVLNEDSYHSFFQAFSRGALRWWAFRPSLMQAEFYRFAGKLVARAGGDSCLFDLKIEALHLIEGNWRIPGPEFAIFEALQGSDAPVILLERRDLVARHVSGQIARRRGQYHSYHAGREIAPFAIDIDAMEAMNAAIRAQTAHIRARFADHPRFAALTYEDLFEPDGAGGRRFAADLGPRMAALLGVEDRFDPVPRLSKVTGADTAELITNAAAVEAARARQPV